MKITMLGTGHATVTECYNTCFVFQEEAACPREYFLVDGGGGNALLKQFRGAGIDWKDIGKVFVTHKHLDHLMGIIWLIRMTGTHMSRGQYEGNLVIYAHGELIAMIRKIAKMLLQEKEVIFLGKRIFLETVQDKECRTILGKEVTFFDIHSTKAKQYGFSMDLGGGKRLACLGDEPYHGNTSQYVKNSEWLLHEAFCLYTQADLFKPYEKHHSTVKEACQTAQAMHVKNLILYHTEDSNLQNRKQAYLAEGRKYYHGNLFVPDDLEVIEL
ncbi:MAG: MBL fold metallo-hydrolase [Lachnospiraceae bacterium]|nr:MBL fold metallo-hydrolase [Lachnospiraceae bacterium]